MNVELVKQLLSEIDEHLARTQGLHPFMDRITEITGQCAYLKLDTRRPEEKAGWNPYGKEAQSYHSKIRAEEYWRSGSK